MDGICPVKVLTRYMQLRKSITDTQPADPFFPKYKAVQMPSGRLSAQLTSPVEEVKYDSFRQALKKLCQVDSVKATGVGNHHTPHSLRMGAISTKANAGVNPIFIQNSARHKQAASTAGYIRPDLHAELHVGDILCGNEGGWNKRTTSNSNSLQPFLPSDMVVPPEKVVEPRSEEQEREFKELVLARNKVRPSVIRSTVAYPPILLRRNGKGRKSKTLTISKKIDPSKKTKKSKKLGKSQDPNLALNKLRTLPGMTITSVSTPQTEEAEKVEGTERTGWGAFSSQDLSDFFGAESVVLCEVSGNLNINPME